MGLYDGDFDNKKEADDEVYGILKDIIEEQEEISILNGSVCEFDGVILDIRDILYIDYKRKNVDQFRVYLKNYTDLYISVDIKYRESLTKAFIQSRYMG